MCIHHIAKSCVGLLLRSRKDEAPDTRQRRPLSAGEKLDLDMMGRCI